MQGDNGEEVAAPDQATAQEGSESEQSGFEKRLAQLEAQKGAYQKVIDTQRETIARLTGEFTSVVERIGARAAPAPKEDEIELDPEEVRKFQKMMSPFTAQIRETQQMINSLAGTLAQRDYEAEASDEDERVVEESKKILDYWKRSGKQGWVAADALNYARGIIAKQDRERARGSVADRADFNSHSRSMGGGGSRMTTSNGAEPVPLPANFADLDPDKQIEILEKRGAHNKPF